MISIPSRLYEHVNAIIPGVFMVTRQPLPHLTPSEGWQIKSMVIGNVANYAHVFVSIGKDRFLNPPPLNVTQG